MGQNTQALDPQKQYPHFGLNDLFPKFKRARALARKLFSKSPFTSQRVWSAKLLFSFHLLARVKAKQEFSIPNALRELTTFFYQ